MKVLVIADYWGPSVYSTGMGAVYRLTCDIGKKGVEVHILSAIRNFKGKIGSNLPNPRIEGGATIHFFDLRWLRLKGFSNIIIGRFFYIFYSIKLNFKYKFNIIHDYSSTPLMFFLGILYSFFGIKTVYTICTKSKMNFFESELLWSRVKFVNKIILTSEYFYRKINKLTDFRGKIAYISLGVKENHYLPVFKKTGKMQIFYIGKDEKRKGSDLFFKAAEKLFDYEFVWITLKTAKKPKKVTVIEGIVDLTKYISFGDICVLPYRNLEGVLFEPQTLLDVMSLGSAVVVSDFPQLRAVTGDSVCYFPAGDLGEMIEKIRYLSNFKKERLGLGKKARVIIAKEFDRNKSIDKIIKIYKEVLNA